MSEERLLRFVAEESLQRLDLTRPPFKVHVIATVEGGRSALLIRVHHAVTDGVGFQTLLDQLSDGTTTGEARRAKRPPPAPIWLAQAALRFWSERGVRQAAAARKADAIAARKALPARARTPVLKLSGATSAARIYAALSLPLASFREIGAGLSATVNDVFLAVAASALRDVLLDLDDLPDAPLVANAARSYRRPEHGSFGNRIVALNPPARHPTWRTPSSGCAPSRLRWSRSWNEAGLRNRCSTSPSDHSARGSGGPSSRRAWTAPPSFQAM